MLVNIELNDTNLAAINAKVIPVAALLHIQWMFANSLKKNKLNQIIKRELRSKQIVGKQTKGKRL